MLKSIIAVLLSAFVLSYGAMAADTSSTSDTGSSAKMGKMGEMAKSVTQACKSDISKYCSDVTEGNGRVMACLKAHEDKLSQGCTQEWKTAKNEWKSNMKAAHAACSGDVQKFCSNVDGPKEIASCLNEHNSDLSNSCKSFRANQTG